MKSERKESFMEDFLSTILEIIEDKPLYVIPIGVYCLLIEIQHHQNAGYFMSNFEAKPMTDPKMGFIAHMNEVSPGTFLCFFKSEDPLTLLVFTVLNLIMYFYYSYLFLLTWAKRHHPEYIQENKKTITAINRLLNTFFTLFWWIFYTPYIEINSGVMVTGGNSFLVASRTDIGDTNYAHKPKYLFVFGTIGLMMTITTCMIVIFFFRNYEFHESNLLKRRYTIVLIGLVITRFVLTFFYYLNFPIVATIKQYFAQMIGIFGIYDYIMYLPFKNRSVSIFYGVSYWFYYVMVWITNLWQLSDLLPPEEHFYIFFIIGSVGGALITQIQNYQTDSLMKIDSENFSIFYKKYDYYLEELMRLTMNSTKDESEKFQVLQLMQFHRSCCLDAECVCKEKTFIDYKNDINIEEISQFIIKRFNWALNHPIIQKDNDEFEHLSLKYISFLAKYKNNSPRAYNELKSLTSKRKNISIYFKTLSNILSKNIEFIMKQTYVRVQQENNQKMKLNEELQINELLLVEDFKDSLLNPMKEYCQQKINFWQKLRSGFGNFEQLKTYSSSISKFGITLQQKYKTEIGKIQSNQVRNNCLFFKMKTIFQVLVVNEISTAFKDQIYLKDLLKRDDLNRFDLLSNSNLLAGYIDYIIISVSKDRGKMLQKTNEKLARFFDYTLQDFASILHLKQLLPNFIGNIHNQLVENMLTRGYSQSVNSVINSFGLSKHGYIFPLNIYINHLYGNAEDFTMHGTLLKIESPNQYILFDNSGTILGITFSLYMKLFDSNQTSDDHEYNIAKIDSGFKTSLAQKIKQFQERVNIQFIIPQISKLIQAFSNQVDQTHQLSSMRSQMMVNGNRLRMKMPRNLYDLAQTFKRKQFNFSRSLKSCRSNVSMTQYEPNTQKVDLLKHENTDLYTDFISENRDFYTGENCLNDFDIKIQLHHNELVYGANYGTRLQYYQLTVTEMNRIAGQNQTLHVNTLYPKTAFSTNQYNSGSFPAWINQNECEQNKSPPPELAMEGSHLGFPINLFNKSPNNNQQNILNDSLIQSAKLESPVHKNQQEIELDRTLNADNSNMVVLESKRQDMLSNFGRTETLNQIVSTDRKEYANQLSLTNRNRDQSAIGWQESERPFQQKPSNDPYLNPKQQNVAPSEMDIVSPTQQSVIEIKNQVNLISFTNRGNEPDNSMEVSVQRDNIAHEEIVKSREDTIEENPEQKPNIQQQVFMNNSYSTFTLNEQKKSMWDKQKSTAHKLEGGHKKQQQNKQNKNQDKSGKREDYLQNQDTKNTSTFEDIFGAKNQEVGGEKPEAGKELESIKSLSESEQIEQRQLQRYNTNSKQSTKSKMKTKDDNKNSVASSQQSMRFDNDIIKDMINTKKMPKAFQRFLILSYLYPPLLIIMSVIYLITVTNDYQTTINNMEDISNIQLLSTNYARSAQNQLISLLMQNTQFTPSSFITQYNDTITADLSAAHTIFQQQIVDYSTMINSREDQVILGSTTTFDVKVSSVAITQDYQLTYPQFIELSLNSISAFINVPSGAKTVINSFQFLCDNFAANINLHLQLFDDQYNQLNSQLNLIQSLFITIFVVQLVASFFFLILQIPQIINLHKYQEKVFLLVTRLYDFETLKEITRLTSILDMLKHPQSGWMKVDFAKLATKDIILNQHQKKTGKQVVLSSQIFDQKVKYHFQLFRILTLFIVSQVYFAASIIVIAIKQTVIQDSFIVNKICQDTNLAMSSFAFSSEILAFEGIIRDQFPDFNALNRTTYLTLQSDAKTQLSTFTSNLQDTLSKFDIFDSSTLNSVNGLVKQNICSIITCPQDQTAAFSNGIVGIIQEQMNLVFTNNDITQNANTPTDQTRLLTFLLQPEQQYTLLAAFNVPLSAMQQLITYFTDGNKTTINNVILFIEIYILIVGMLVLLFSLYVTKKLKDQIKLQTIEINFLLTFIPHEKMTEEATIHMLKSLSNCY